MFTKGDEPDRLDATMSDKPNHLIDHARLMVPGLSRGVPFVYILRLRSGGLYVGCSTDLESRFRGHANGTACRTTRIDPPVAVQWIELHEDLAAARQRETQIKKWSRAKKGALISGDTAALRRLARSRD